MDNTLFTDVIKELYIRELPNLKRYVMMAPFVYCFDKFLKNEKFDPIRIPYRDEENIYLMAYEKSLVVIYSIKFKDADDVILARWFLQVSCSKFYSFLKGIQRC